MASAYKYNFSDKIFPNLNFLKALSVTMMANNEKPK